MENAITLLATKVVDKPCMNTVHCTVNSPLAQLLEYFKHLNTFKHKGDLEFFFYFESF